MKLNDKRGIILGGSVVGIVSALLAYLGNPQNMGFCIACFIRDLAGSLGLHGNAKFQYFRPEIIGIILGSFLISVIKKEFTAKGGSAPLTRFALGFLVMEGCMMFMGCPFRMILRMAGGDINAYVGLIGFVLGILTGVVFLKRGFSLGRNYRQSKMEGLIVPTVITVLLVVALICPSILKSSQEGLGSKHAPMLISLAAGLIVGAIAQRTRLCMAGGIRDVFLFKDGKLISGFISIFLSALITNLILSVATSDTYLVFSAVDQTASHNVFYNNILGMYLVGLGSILLGGCPLRQLVLTGEGNTDSAVTFMGLVAGVVFAYGFGLFESNGQMNLYGELVVYVGIVAALIIGLCNSRRKS